jgi:hypothetical protein
MGNGENYDDRITQWWLLWKSQHFQTKLDDYGQQLDAVSRLNERWLEATRRMNSTERQSLEDKSFDNRQSDHPPRSR